MINLNLKNIVWKEGKDYVSLNLNTSVSSFGKTKKEALDSLEEALELYFEDIPVAKVAKNMVQVERPNIVSLKLQHA